MFKQQIVLRPRKLKFTEKLRVTRDTCKVCALYPIEIFSSNFLMRCNKTNLIHTKRNTTYIKILFTQLNRYRTPKQLNELIFND